VSQRLNSCILFLIDLNPRKISVRTAVPYHLGMKPWGEGVRSRGVRDSSNASSSGGSSSSNRRTRTRRRIRRSRTRNV